MASVERQLSKIFHEVGVDVRSSELVAMNRAAKSALSKLIDEIRKDYPIKKKDFTKSTSKRRGFIRIIRATKSKPHVTLIIDHSPMGLYYFQAKNLVRGMKATEKRGRRRYYKNAFVHDNRIVFMRTGEFEIMKKGSHKGKKREKIKKMYGPSVQQLASSEQSEIVIKLTLQSKFEDYFYDAFQHFTGNS